MTRRRVRAIKKLTVPLDAQVLLLDDLGSHRVTDWVEDTVTSIVTYRCNTEAADRDDQSERGRHGSDGVYDARRNPGA